jgi:MFS family permease
VATATATATTAEAVESRRWLALVVVVSASFMAVVDQFVVSGYALTYAVTLDTGGRLGDIYGRKRLFMLGMAGFALASAVVALRYTIGPLLLGFCAGLALPTAERVAVPLQAME